jgi:hypothetical protein
MATFLNGLQAFMNNTISGGVILAPGTGIPTGQSQPPIKIDISTGGSCPSGQCGGSQVDNATDLYETDYEFMRDQKATFFGAFTPKIIKNSDNNVTNHHRKVIGIGLIVVAAITFVYYQYGK